MNRKLQMNTENQVNIAFESIVDDVIIKDDKTSQLYRNH